MKHSRGKLPDFKLSGCCEKHHQSLKNVLMVINSYLRRDQSPHGKTNGILQTSLVCLWLTTLQCLALFCFPSCVASSAGLAAFTQTVEKYAKAASIPNTLIGTYSRSRSVAAISLLEQEKSEEAKESLAQTALTLSLLDIGGRVALPVTEKIVDYVETRRKFRNTRRAFEAYNEVLELEFRKPANIDQTAIQRAKEALKNTFKADINKYPRLSKVGKVLIFQSKQVVARGFSLRSAWATHRYFVNRS